MRVLAVDHGDVRCGLALSDRSGTLATPHSTVSPDPETIAALARAEEVERVVVGIPLTPSGETGEQARAARSFADALAEELGELVPVVGYDERLTTRQAEASRREGARAGVDAMAAAHLLTSYLESLERVDG